MQVAGRSRVWIFRYRSRREKDKKTSRMRDVWLGLGSADTVLLVTAQAAAMKEHQLMGDKNYDPQEAREQARKLQRKVSGLAKTVNEVIDEWRAAHVDPMPRENSRKAAKRYLLRLSEGLGSMAIDEVTTKDALGLLLPWYQTTLPQGVQLHSFSQRVFGMARANYGLKENPFRWEDNLDQSLGTYVKNYRSKPRRGLHRDVAAKFLAEVRAYKDRRPKRTGRMVSTYICEMVVLTGIRVSEITQATWSEINMEEKRWTVPWQHLKTGEDFQCDRPIPITTSMMQILQEMRRRTNRLGGNDPVFQNDDGGHYHYSATLRFINGSLRAMDGVNDWLPEIDIHGFRQTLTGWGQNSPHGRPHLVGIQLDHVPPGTPKHLRGYHEQDDDWALRSEMMEHWDKHCRTKPPAQVVTEPRKKVVNLFK